MRGLLAGLARRRRAQDVVTVGMRHGFLRAVGARLEVEVGHDAEAFANAGAQVFSREEIRGATGGLSRRSVGKIGEGLALRNRLRPLILARIRPTIRTAVVIPATAREEREGQDCNRGEREGVAHRDYKMRTPGRRARANRNDRTSTPVDMGIHCGPLHGRRAPIHGLAGARPSCSPFGAGSAGSSTPVASGSLRSRPHGLRFASSRSRIGEERVACRLRDQTGARVGLTEWGLPDLAVKNGLSRKRGHASQVARHRYDSAHLRSEPQVTHEVAKVRVVGRQILMYHLNWDTSLSSNDV
jgi:hypothetical protein